MSRRLWPGSRPLLLRICVDLRLDILPDLAGRRACDTMNCMTTKADALSALFGRPVGLVMSGAVRTPRSYARASSVRGSPSMKRDSSPPPLGRPQRGELHDSVQRMQE